MPESQQPIEGRDLMIERILAGPCSHVLDVGAGSGKWGCLLKGKVRHLTALEVWVPVVEKYRLGDPYDEVVISDVRHFNQWDEYDVAILGDVLEHMNWASALTVIERIKAAGIRAFLTVPISLCEQDGTVYGNPYETHLDQWTHEELEATGWKLLHRGTNEAGTVEIGTYELEPIR